MKDIQSLPNDPAMLKDLLQQVMARNVYLEEQFRLAQQKRCGASSEGHPGQGELFNEPESEVDAAVMDNEVHGAERPHNKPKRQPLPKDLPREIIVHDIVEAEKVCQCCGGALHPFRLALSQRGLQHRRY